MRKTLPKIVALIPLTHLSLRLLESPIIKGTLMNEVLLFLINVLHIGTVTLTEQLVIETHLPLLNSRLLLLIPGITELLPMVSAGAVAISGLLPNR